MPPEPKKIYFVTGKGGVGKTTIAASLALYLKNNNHNVLHVTTGSGDKETTQILKNEGVETLDLNVHSSSEMYIAKKLKSKMLASWITDSTLFKTIFNMTPAIGQLIMLGHIVDISRSTPDLKIIIDAPASGHTLTMFESLKNFKAIFGTGILVKDITTIQEYFFSNKHLHIIISALPYTMAINEGLELKSQLSKIIQEDITIILNNTLIGLKEHLEDLPNFLYSKVSIELEIFNKYKDKFNFVIPHIPEVSQHLVISETKNFVGEII